MGSVLQWDELDDRAVDTARVLAADAVEKVGNGHPGTAISLAPAAYLLYQKVMRHDPRDAGWIGRDRFILSIGHSSLTQYVQLYLGGFGLTIALVLVVVSLFAAQLAFHNSAGRYLFSLGRARVLPHWLAVTNKKGSPERALIVNFAFAVIVAAIFRFTFPDLPAVVTLVPVGLGFATLAIMIVQAIAALAVVAYFRKKNDPRIWSTLVAPGLGFLALAVFSVMAIVNFATVAGSSETYVLVLPWILVVAVVGGIGYGAYLKAKKPDVYAGLSDDLEKFDEELAEASAGN